MSNTRSKQQQFGRTSRAMACAAVLAVMGGACGSAAHAASAIWKTAGFTDGDWATATNWVGEAAPGVTGTGGTNTDVATFNGASNTTVTVDTQRSIGSILFDTADAGAFTLQTGTLYVVNGGNITIADTVVNAQTITSPIIFTNATSSKTYAFTNNSVESGVSLNIDGDITGRNNATLTLTIGGAGNGQISGDIGKTGSGNVAITKTGAGAWTLSGTNTHGGTTTLSEGQLNLNSASALGTGEFRIGTGTTIDNTSGSAITMANANSITITGTGFTFKGTNSLTFAGTPGTATGAVAISVTAKTITLEQSLTFNGELRGTNDGSVIRTIIANGAGHTLTFGGFGINTGGSGGRTGEIGGDAFVTFTGDVRNGGGGTQALKYSGTSVLTLLADNTYTGGTTINAGGTLQIGNGGTTGSFANSTTNGITNNGTLIVNRSTDSSLVKIISGSGVVTKMGAGALTLTRVNTYGGATNITGGTLVLSDTASILNSSAINLGAGATLDTVAKASFSMDNDQPFTFTLNPAGAGSAGLLLADGLNITNAVVTFNALGALNDSVYVIASYNSLTGTQFASISGQPGSHSIEYAYNGNQIALVAIPEPASLVLLAIGGLLICGRRHAGRNTAGV
ncbi:MAG: autotransporter-associated beta strand repeat-containing protein [Phycisphaeraceae bacterium]